MKESNLIADSTFYLFFIDDINQTDYLSRIISKFPIYVSPTIKRELMKCKNKKFMKEFLSKANLFKDDLNMGALVKPLISKKEEEKGEYEVIVLAYMCYNLNINFLAIIDDKQPYNFVHTYFDYLTPFLKRTAGFILTCHTEFNIFKKNETINILKDMKKSKFKIKDKTVDIILKKLENV